MYSLCERKRFPGNGVQSNPHCGVTLNNETGFQLNRYKNWDFPTRVILVNMITTNQQILTSMFFIILIYLKEAACDGRAGYFEGFTSQGKPVLNRKPVQCAENSSKSGFLFCSFFFKDRLPFSNLC